MGRFIFTTTLTALGPIVIFLSSHFQTQWLFWVGAVFSVIVLLLDLASGVLRFPILPLLFAVAGIVMGSGEWYVGAILGLVTYQVVEVVGRLYALIRTYM